MKHRKKKANKDMREDFLVSELVDVSIRNYELKQNLKHVEVYQHSLENQIASINLSKAYALWQKVSGPVKLFFPFVSFIRRLELKTRLLLERREKDCFDIIIFGCIPWDFRFQRPQHLAQELARNGHRVFYVSPQFEIYRDDLKLDIQKTKEKRVYKVAPWATRQLFIHYHHPSKEDVRIFRLWLKQIIKDACIKKSIIKIDHPFWISYLRGNNYPLVYDCMDNHSAFEIKLDNIDILEKKVVKQSSLVLASSNYLFKKMKKYSPRQLLLLKNAVDFDFFNKQLTEEDLSSTKIKKPIIGYYGAICEWFDENLLERVAMAFPKMSIVLIGNVNNEAVRHLAEKYNNIILLGEKPYGEIPKYLELFDVCMVPFKLTPLIRATDPVKVYEFLSKGKPVVVVNMPELRNIGKYIYLSSSKEDFVLNIKKAFLQSKSQSVVKFRKQIANENTWHARSEVLEKALEKISS